MKNLGVAYGGLGPSILLSLFSHLFPGGPSCGLVETPERGAETLVTTLPLALEVPPPALEGVDLALHLIHAPLQVQKGIRRSPRGPQRGLREVL